MKVNFGWDHLKTAGNSKRPPILFNPNCSNVELIGEHEDSYRYYLYNTIPHETFSIRGDFPINSENLVPVDEHVLQLIERDEKFIYVVGTSDGPHYWLGINPDKPAVGPLFENIPENVKNHIRRGKVLIVLDMTLEGFPIDYDYYYEHLKLNVNLAEVFHKRCEQLGFPIKNLAFLNGNHLNEKYYREWCEEHEIVDRFTMLTSYHMATHCQYYVPELEYPDFQSVFDYKKKNVDTIKKFLNLAGRNRGFRIAAAIGLNYHGLLEQGINGLIISADISSSLPNSEDFMLNQKNKDDYLYDLINRKCEEYNSSESKANYYFHPDNLRDFINKLPLKADLEEYVIDLSLVFNEQLYLNTVFDFGLETFFHEQNAVMITEKLYKCAAYYHPFVCVSTPGTVEHWNKIGYKSFSGFINEEYDVIEDNNTRMIAVIEETERLCDMTNVELLDWYGSQEDILVHNHNFWKRNEQSNILAKKIYVLYEELV